MTRQALIEHIFQKRSYLCVGLDPDPTRLPPALAQEPDPVFAFNRQIVEATADLCVAYKPNLAFYERLGPAGLETLEKTLEIIPKTHFRIADAKRGDVGHTATCYAEAFFRRYRFDAVTVAPYMGADSVSPFLAFEDKWTILLALTSNAGSADFQKQPLAVGESLYEHVIAASQGWPGADRLMYVVGATQADALRRVRALAPQAFLLVPGVGAQGGSLAEVSRHGLTPEGGLLVNASRSILYASNGDDFAAAARRAAADLQRQMADLLPPTAP